MTSTILFCMILTFNLPLTIFADGMDGMVCDVSQGEVFLPTSCQVSNYAACKKSCEDEPECKSITFYGNINEPGFCTHFSTECKKTVPSEDGDAISIYLKGEECAAKQGWRPKNRQELQDAILECLKVSDDCSNGPHGPIGEWDVTLVTDMHWLFLGRFGTPYPGVEKFIGDVSKWDVSRVTNMHSLFRATKSFNGDVSKWDVSKVTEMSSLFTFCTSFNGDLSKWDVSGVSGIGGMDSMFYGAHSFNGDISKWDVSRVGHLHSMFWDAKSFNGDVSKWDVSKTTDMRWAFKKTASFDQTLCDAWKTAPAKKGGMFDESKGRLC